jgi:hypothetical protein
MYVHRFLKIQSPSRMYYVKPLARRLSRNSCLKERVLPDTNSPKSVPWYMYIHFTTSSRYVEDFSEFVACRAARGSPACSSSVKRLLQSKTEGEGGRRGGWRGRGPA